MEAIDFTGVADGEELISIRREQQADAAERHDWSRYFDVVVQVSKEREHRWRSRGMDIIASKEPMIQDSHTNWEPKVVSGYWFGSKESLPATYSYKPGCDCLVCLLYPKLPDFHIKRRLNRTL